MRFCTLDLIHSCDGFLVSLFFVSLYSLFPLCVHFLRKIEIQTVPNHISVTNLLLLYL